MGDEMIKTVTRRLLLVLTATLMLPLTSTALATEHSADKQKLFDALAGAKNAQVAQQAEAAIWEHWFNESPNQNVRASLDAGMERREAYDYEAAENHFDVVVKFAPDYAEGYNQRAFIRFLRENYEEAQADLEVVLSLEPDHFGAMSGLYHILQTQNRPKAALKMLRRAVAIHPWLNEHTLLPEAMWPDNYRKIHEPGQEI